MLTWTRHSDADLVERFQTYLPALWEAAMSYETADPDDNREEVYALVSLVVEVLLKGEEP